MSYNYAILSDYLVYPSTTVPILGVLIAFCYYYVQPWALELLYDYLLPNGSVDTSLKVMNSFKPTSFISSILSFLMLGYIAYFVPKLYIFKSR